MEAALEIVLEKIKSGNQVYIREAEVQCNTWENENFAIYAFNLCGYLINSAKDAQNRELAGILLKGLLSAKDAQLASQKSLRWLQSTPVEARTKIKEGLVSILGAPERGVRQKTAQTIACVALIELPQGQWQELVVLLCNNVTTANKSPHLKQASLETLGYICEEIDPQVLAGAADQILTAVVHGMRPEEQNVEVKRAACTALFNALDFCRQNFENPKECSVLLNVILEATIVPDELVRVLAYYLLVEVAAMHYDKLTSFMHRIFKITLAAIKAGGPEDVAKQAIEFWSTICEEEINIIEETETAKEYGGPPPQRTCNFYIKGALEHLVQVITETLNKQPDSETGGDDLTLPMAAGTCLDLIARTVHDDVVPHVMRFIERNIMSPDWRNREAAVLAFGSVLDGPTTAIAPMITQAIPVLLQHMKDQKTHVKDTTAWTLGRILQLHHKSVLNYAEAILKVLGEALSEKPRVAANAAWAIHNLALSMQQEEANPLKKYFNDVVKTLLVTGERNDGDDQHLRTSAYEALNVVLANAPENAVSSLEALTGIILERLEQTFALEIVSQDDVNKQTELQGLLCGVLQVIMQRIAERIMPQADRIMKVILALFKSKSDSSVHEEAFLTVGALANAIDVEFTKYMTDFNDHLCIGLNNWQEHQVCCVAVGVVGDVARALQGRLVPFCDKIITLLLQNLQNKQLDRSVKPPILSCFGDIALAIGGGFERYLDVVMRMLQQAAETVATTDFSTIEDIDLMDYMNSLREGIFEAYTGIIQGLRADRKGDKIEPHVGTILALVNHVASDPRRTEGVSRCAVGICGDLALSLKGRIRNDLRTPVIEQLIAQTLQQAEGDDTKETVTWARQVISDL